MARCRVDGIGRLKRIGSLWNHHNVGPSRNGLCNNGGKISIRGLPMLYGSRVPSRSLRPFNKNFDGPAIGGDKRFEIIVRRVIREPG